MERLFLTLSDREDEVAQMIGAGLEAKEQPTQPITQQQPQSFPPAQGNNDGLPF